MAKKPVKKTRRMWTSEKKRSIVDEANKPGAVKSHVAKKHGITDAQLYTWERSFGLTKTAVKPPPRRTAAKFSGDTISTQVLHLQALDWLIEKLTQEREEIKRQLKGRL